MKVERFKSRKHFIENIFFIALSQKQFHSRYNFGYGILLYIQKMPYFCHKTALFGIGNAFDSIVSLAAYAFLLKKEKINILNVQ